MKSLLSPLLVVFALTFCATVFAADDEWNPGTTWVFAVGVLNYDAPNLRTWPEETRADATLIEAFKKRGVPESQIVFLKNSGAMKYHVDSQFYSLLCRTKPGDTLIFYYAGHGRKSNDDPIHFVTYDTASRWYVSEIFSAIETQFKGDRAILTTDCCYSGALAVEAAKKSGRIKYSVLASAHANSLSTGHWTFTQFLVDMFNGSAILDRNHDGKISFAEAAEQCEEEMAICERQMNASYFSEPESGGKLVVSKAQGNRASRAGEFCECMDGAYWSRAKIIESGEDQVRLAWAAWDGKKEKTRWVPANSIRKFEPKVYSPGTQVTVERNMGSYRLISKGRVLASKYGLHLVHYDDRSDSDDEWLRPDRIKVDN